MIFRLLHLVHFVEHYRIHVHTLKGTSLTVGLPGLSELAREVELAVLPVEIMYQFPGKIFFNHLL